MSVSERTSDGATFELDPEAGRLTVRGDLNNSAEKEFGRACRDVLAQKPEEFLIDLSAVEYLSTACMGVLFVVEEEASRRGTKVRVRLSQRMAGICRMAGLDKLVNLDVS